MQNKPSVAERALRRLADYFPSALPFNILFRDRDKTPRSPTINQIEKHIDDATVQTCWHRSFYAFATAYAFSRRTSLYRRLLNFISALGVATPAILGTLVISFGTKLPHIALLVVICTIVGLAQFVLSMISVIYGWPAALESSMNSTIENNAISDKFQLLAKMASDKPPPDFDARYRELMMLDDQQRKVDARIGLSDSELRRGHRAALRNFQWPCTACMTVPVSMDPSNCGICGDF